MWSSFNHPGGRGRRYLYRANKLCGLSCWTLQPSKYAPKGEAVKTYGISRWRSNRTGELSASATWRISHDGLERRFFITPMALKRFAEQTISMVPDSVAKTNNLRWWWKCPDCGRRCGVLFLIPATGLFTCRKCGRVTYESQQEASPGRVFARMGIAWPKGARGGRKAKAIGRV